MKTKIGWLIGLTKGYRKLIFYPLTLNVLSVFLSIAFVELTKILFEGVNNDVSFLSFCISLLVITKVLELFCEQREMYLREKACAKLENIYTLRLFENTFKSARHELQNIHSGDEMSRLTTDVSVIAQCVTYTIPTIIYASVQLIATSIYLLFVQSSLTVAIICIMPIMILLGKQYTKKIVPISRDIRLEDSSVNEYMQEHLQKHEMLVSFGVTSFIVDKVRALQDKLFSSIRRRIFLDVVAESFVDIGFALGYLAIIIWGVFGIQNGTFTYAMLIVFMQLVGQLQRPFIFFKTQFPALMNSYASIERLQELENMEKEDATYNVRLEGAVGVKFQNVFFKYSKSDKWVLNDFTFDFAPGSITALIGETGIGKSTILRLILAFNTPNKGYVELYNSQKNVSANSSTRCNCTYVPQGNSILSGTIRYNLKIGNLYATDREINEALYNAAADFVLNDLPKGLDTIVGENGLGLSEGQAQRIAIARGLLHNGQLLLLDEPTSALDDITEKIFLDRLHNKRSNKTIIIISHKKEVGNYVDNNLLLE